MKRDSWKHQAFSPDTPCEGEHCPDPRMPTTAYWPTGQWPPKILCWTCCQAEDDRAGAEERSTQGGE